LENPKVPLLVQLLDGCTMLRAAASMLRDARLKLSGSCKDDRDRLGAAVLDIDAALKRVASVAQPRIDLLEVRRSALSYLRGDRDGSKPEVH
jgi:hypothetical protein